MLLPQSIRSRTALTLATFMVSAVALPFAGVRSAHASQPYFIAQRFPNSWRSAVAAGTEIPTTYDKERIILTPGETVPVDLIVAENITTSGGSVVIPEGSIIEGRLEPAGDGTQFIARTLVLDDGDLRVPIDATSDIITRRETISRRTDPDILRGAAIGAAAGAVLGEIFGSIDLWEVLGGAGVGTLAEVVLRGREEVEVISIDTATDLTLYLESDFNLDQRSRG
jgi:hypothetical protein